jgi:hypothetical protein
MIEELSRSEAMVIGPQARLGQLAEAPPALVKSASTMLCTALELAEAGPEAVFVDQSVEVSEAGLRFFLGTFRYSPQ